VEPVAEGIYERMNEPMKVGQREGPTPHHTAILLVGEVSVAWPRGLDWGIATTSPRIIAEGPQHEGVTGDRLPG